MSSFSQSVQFNQLRNKNMAPTFFSYSSRRLEVIHKPCGQFFDNFDLIFTFMDHFIKLCLEVICTFGYPLPCPHGLWLTP